MASKCCKPSKTRQNGRPVSLEFFHQIKRSANVIGTYGNELKTTTTSYITMRGFVETKQGEVVSGDEVLTKTIAYFECNYFDGLLVDDIVKFTDNCGNIQVFKIANIENQNFHNKTYKIQATHEYIE